MHYRTKVLKQKTRIKKPLTFCVKNKSIKIMFKSFETLKENSSFQSITLNKRLMFHWAYYSYTI